MAQYVFSVYIFWILFGMQLEKANALNDLQSMSVNFNDIMTRPQSNFFYIVNYVIISFGSHVIFTIILGIYFFMSLQIIVKIALEAIAMANNEYYTNEPCHVISNNVVF